MTKRIPASEYRQLAKRAHKYNARPVIIDGQRFASQGEAQRYRELKLMELAGVITNLRTQVRFPLHAPGGERISVYVADFVYEMNGETVVEDFKGFRTKSYKTKRRWMLAEYGIQVREITDRPSFRQCRR